MRTRYPFAASILFALLTTIPVRAEEPPIAGEPAAVESAAKELPAAEAGKWQKAGQEIKEAATAVGEATKETGTEVWGKTKEGSQEVWQKTKEKSAEIVDRTKEGGAEVWDKTKEGSQEVWQKTKEKSAEIVDKGKATYKEMTATETPVEQAPEVPPAPDAPAGSDTAPAQ